MANNKSARKRIDIAERNRLNNKFYRTSAKNLTKLFYKVIELYRLSQDLTKKEEAENLLRSLYSIIDKGCKNNVFHPNTAARKKARLAAILKAV